MFKHISQCRACGGSNLKSVFDLGLQPLANDFRKASEYRCAYYPLNVMFCKDCTLAQLSVVVDPATMYSHYSYVTSNSDTMKLHFSMILGDMSRSSGAKSMLEVGSNNGAFLAEAMKRGFYVMGVDPASNLVDEANTHGIQTRCTFFGSSFDPCEKFDIVVARHVFCHCENWKDFVAGLENVTHDNSEVWVEVPYVLDMIKGNEWDTIYHEHMSYLSIRALTALLKDSKFEINRITRYKIHGGAVMIVLTRKEAMVPKYNSVADFLKQEEYYSADSWWSMWNNRLWVNAMLKSILCKIKQEGKAACGFGASAKSTVLINSVGLTENHLAFVTDTTTWKQGAVSPGTTIPVKPESSLMDVDYAVMFAWNYKDEILEKQKAFRDKGGKFILPLSAEIV